MTRTEARNLINTAGRRHTLVVRFVKCSGRLRRMVCRYYGSASQAPHLMTVWDVERGGVRSINLDTVESITVVERPAERSTAPPTASRALDEARAEMAYLFG